MAGRFRSGDHLKVRRPRGYDHHGIYISDDRVIQFGSGITLTDKSRTAVSAVTLAEFVQGGTATVERHGYESMLDTGYHPPADEGWKVVARAEFLLKLQHRLPYNLIGHNCEIIADMCASRELDRELPGAPVVRPQGRSRRSAALRHCGPLSGRPVTPALGNTGHHRVGSRRATVTPEQHCATRHTQTTSATMV
jgi:lecithin:retinol acyltransferase